MEGEDPVKYVCSICREEAFHNEILDVYFCKKHGFNIMPVFPETSKSKVFV